MNPQMHPCTLLLILLHCSSTPAFSQDVQPWETNTPIVDVRREDYQPKPRPDVSLWLDTCYVGPGLVREERYSEMALPTGGDVLIAPRRRVSRDNGRTWGEYEPLPVIAHNIGGTKIQIGRIGRQFYDPETRAIVALSHNQIHKHYPFNKHNDYQNHLFSKVSLDGGATWSPLRQLRFEEAGEPFDPDDPLREGFVRHNQVYPGNNIIRHSNGTLIHGAAEVMVPYREPNGEVVQRSIGSLCFIGRWDAVQRNYSWKAGKPVWVLLEVSERGLMETTIAELPEGRLLIVWRTDAGRKFFSTSTDGGETLTPPAEWRYDDGSRFYSPSSPTELFRHSVTHKLYMIGNISPVPPPAANANSPRFPLVIAEIDESRAAIKRSTVTLIDTRRAGEGLDVQLTNFSLLENRETHAVELFLTPIQVNPASIFDAGVRRYTLTFPPPAASR